MVPGLDMDRVSKHLEDISMSLRVLESLRATPFAEFAADPKIHWAVENGLQRCIQNVLDASAHVLAAIGGPVPDDYASILFELGKRGTLPREFAARISPMADLRDNLVLGYLDVDLREVYDTLQNRLDDFRTFAQHLIRFLEANE
jgi:uncharacterized protein YutE (UPF0331/DUF86 family)